MTVPDAPTFSSKASRGSFATSAPAARAAGPSPTWIGYFPGVAARTSGTSRAKARERKFVSSVAAKSAPLGADGATTTSTVSAVTETPGPSSQGQAAARAESPHGTPSATATALAIRRAGVRG